MKKPVLARARFLVVALVVLLAGSCGNSEDSTSSPVTNSASATPTTTANTPATGGEECSNPPPTSPSEGFSFATLEERLRDTPADIRLASDAGSPTELLAVGEDVIVLEEVTDLDSYSPSEGGLYSRADLILRRVAMDGSTQWTLRLGTFVNGYRTYQNPSMVLDGESVRIVWPRFDGGLPAALDTAVPATLVVSTVGTDGRLDSDVDIRSIPATDEDTGWVSLTTAIGATGSVVVGGVEGDTLVVEMFDPNGRAMWRDELGSEQSPIPLVAVLADDEVAAAWGGHLVRWTADGDRRWDLPLDPSSLAPITPAPGSSDADLVVGMAGGGIWFCAIDSNGQLVLQTSEAESSWGSAERAWWTESGLMLLSRQISLGANDNLIVIGHNGDTLWDVQLAAGGDAIGAPRSAVLDAMITDDGAVVLAAAVAGHPPEVEPIVGNLETWTALIELPTPAGAGDLSQLPPITE